MLKRQEFWKNQKKSKMIDCPISFCKFIQVKLRGNINLSKKE